MNDFQAGDKVRIKARDELDTTDPRLTWEVLFVGEFVAVLRQEGNGPMREISRSLHLLRDQWELIPEIFEASKRYQKTSVHSTEPDIEVMWADKVVAFGRYCGTGKHTRHALLYPAERHLYREV